ncbi:DUF397 domain-containing protein [Streptomyces gamaensis]|uniref:DUF397 domain-containing protein n=1 Tax=Streptomyces gamaensis TaxID=1763542 RepID=A0ABW0YQ00_9ACTN
MSSTAHRKNTYTPNQQSGRLEVTDRHPEFIPVRDSKNPTGPTLLIPNSAWTTFITTVTTTNGSLTS